MLTPHQGTPSWLRSARAEALALGIGCSGADHAVTVLRSPRSAEGLSGGRQNAPTTSASPAENLPVGAPCVCAVAWYRCRPGLDGRSHRDGQGRPGGVLAGAVVR